MFGVSFFEIAIVFIIALFFFKPAQIIMFFGKVYQFFEKVKLETEMIKNDILTKEILEVKDEIYKDFIENEFEKPENKIEEK